MALGRRHVRFTPKSGHQDLACYVRLQQLWQLRNIRRDPPRLIARELCGALRDGALRAHGAIGWDQFAAGGLTRIEADTVSSWDYNCRKSRLEQLRSLRLQC